MDSVNYRIDIAAEVDGGQINFEHRVSSNSAMTAFTAGVHEFEDRHGTGAGDADIDQGVVTRIVATLSIDQDPSESSGDGVAIEDATPGA